MSSITHRFKGESIEDALATVSSEMGPTAQIVDVRRARTGGLFGFFAREHFEVVAAEPETDFFAELRAGLEEEDDLAADDTHPIDLRLAALVDRTDAIEQSQALPSSPPPRPADHWMERLTSAISTAPAGGDGGLDPDLAGASVTTLDPMALQAPAASALGWSRAALRARGVPEDVLGRLPAEDPEDDIAWTNALARAIAAVLPDPVSAPFVSVSCSAVEGVFDLLAAAALGIPVATMRVDGRDVPATPMELALAVRSCLRR